LLLPPVFRVRFTTSVFPIIASRVVPLYCRSGRPEIDIRRRKKSRHPSVILARATAAGRRIEPIKPPPASRTTTRTF